VIDADARAAHEESTSGAGAGGESAGGGGGTGGGDTGLYPDFASFCHAIGVAECSSEIVSRCQIPSREACVAEVSRACSDKTSEITRGFSAAGYQQAAAEGCVAEVSGAYAAGQITADGHRAIVTACQEVFRLGKGVGSDCAVDTDCAAALGCYLTDTGQGTCQKISTVASGEDCSASGAVCAAGLYCGADKACVARGEEGEDCSPFARPCAEALRCVIADAAAGTGACAARLTPGQDCLVDGDCATGFCALVGAQSRCEDTLSIGTGAAVCEDFDGK
jgi:hypothetical protein